MIRPTLLKWVAGLLLLPLLFGSCSYVSTSNLDLLQAPVLNQRQAALQQALERTLNLSDIVYCYPRTGEYRSPFIFSDLDGDGREEAIVLYAYSSNVDEVRAALLRQTDSGEWVSLRDIAGKGDQVDFIQFSHLLTRESLCLIIGWGSSGNKNQVLEVYSLSAESISQQVEREYKSHVIYDFQGDGLSDIVLVSPGGQGFEVLLLQGEGNSIVAVDALPLEQDVGNILQMLQGRLWDGTAAMYIDLEHEYGIVSTEVVGVSDGVLLPVASSQSDADSTGYSSYTSTFRGERVLSIDLYGNAEVLVPRMQELPRSIESDELESLELTEYRQLTEDGYFSVDHAAVNQEEGYLVFFPERWLGEVTVVVRPEIREWQFYKVDPDTREPSVELFRVRVYTAGDYIDRFTENYIHLEARGILSYYGYVPPQEEEPLSLTMQEAQTLFMLLS